MKKIVLSLFTLGIGAFALNAQTLDQSNTASQSSTWLVNSGGNTSNGQSFTAGMSGFLSSISINIDATNPSLPTLAGSFTLTVRSGNGYGGTILGIDTFTVTGTEPTGFLSISIKPNTVAVTAGNSYTYIVDEISGTGQLIIAASGNNYAGGDLYSQVFTNPPTIDATRDFIFQTFMQSSLTCNIADQTVTASQTTLCDSGAVSISTGSSETGYNYYLRDDADSSIVDGPVAGTGNAINFNTGTINSTTTYNVYAKEPKISAVDLANNNDFIRFNAPFTAYTNEITVEAWVQFNGSNFVRGGQSSALIDNMATNVWLWEGGSFFVNNNGIWISLQFPTITTTGWMHVATVANSSGMFIYYDGVLVASNTTGITSGIQSNTSAVLELGHDPRFTPSSRNNDVVYDNFRVWSVTRSASEVADNYKTCLSGSETGLVQYTLMNEATGTTLNSLQGDNGIITNGIANPWVLGSGVCDDACDLEMTQTVTITVNTTQNGTDVQTACNSFTWIDNVTYTASNNTATHTIIGGATSGCDSVVTLNLTINNSATGTDVQTACNSYTWMDNNTYTSSNNTATHTIVGGAANGCDSVVTLNLTINNSATGTDVQTACNSYTWIDNNTYTTSNNTATYTIVGGATNGCDSVVTLDLTITTVDNSTTLNVNTISANQNSASYQWLDCDNGNAIISGATAQNFTPTVTGNYAVEVTLGSCVDTSTCTNVIITNIDEVGMENINIYPNPTKDDINVELPLNEFTSVEVKIYSVTGKLVYKNAQHNVNKLVINTANWDKGLYFIQLISNNQTITKKIIKQ